MHELCMSVRNVLVYVVATEVLGLVRNRGIIRVRDGSVKNTFYMARQNVTSMRIAIDLVATRSQSLLESEWNIDLSERTKY